MVLAVTYINSTVTYTVHCPRTVFLQSTDTEQNPPTPPSPYNLPNTAPSSYIILNCTNTLQNQLTLHIPYNLHIPRTNTTYSTFA